MATDSAIAGNSSVTVGAASSQVLAANSGRIAAYISNDHASQVAYLSLGSAAVVNSGIRLGPGQTIRLDDYRGSVFAWATGASTVLTVATY